MTSRATKGTAKNAPTPFPVRGHPPRGWVDPWDSTWIEDAILRELAIAADRDLHRRLSLIRADRGQGEDPERPR